MPIQNGPVKDRSGVARDVKVDFFRGAALLIVSVDHIEGLNDLRFASRWTPGSLGISDAAEWFVFLSGWTFGLVYTSRLPNLGLNKCLLKVLCRSFQIYLAYLLTLFSVLLITSLTTLGRSSHLFEILHWHVPLAGQAGHAFGMSNQPFGFAILPFYVLVLPCTAIGLHLMSWSKPFVVGVSFAIYLLVQMVPSFNLHTAVPERSWFFNPFAWQFLFVLGMVLGSERRNFRHGRAAILVTMVCGLLVISIGFCRLIDECLIPGHRQPYVNDFSWMWSHHKTRLGPFRLVHFLACAWLASRLSPDLIDRLPGSRFVQSIGRNSLPVYCVGLVLGFLSVLFFEQFGTEGSIVLIYQADMVGLLGLVALLSSRRAQSSSA